MPAVNTAPASLLALAEAAVLRGLDRVFLGFEGLGADFPAPIGWLLHLHQQQTDPGAPNTLRVTMQDHDGSPEAYVGGNWQNPVYWGQVEIREWIAGTPEPDAAATARYAADWSRVALAYGNGWEVAREVRTSDHAVTVDVARRHGIEVDHRPPVSMEVSALNHFFNIDGHPDHRDTGAPVSVRASLSIPAPGEERSFLSMDGDGGTLVYGGASEFEDVISETARWFVSVAVYDDTAEEWVLPPEATAWRA